MSQGACSVDELFLSGGPRWTMLFCISTRTWRWHADACLLWTMPGDGASLLGSPDFFPAFLCARPSSKLQVMINAVATNVQRHTKL